MPKPAAGDVLVIHSAKVQSYRNTISLIAHKSTSFYIYSAADIPKPPQSALCALQSPQNARTLGEADHEYVSCLYHFTNRDSIPDEITFQNRVDQSARRKDKFCKLDSVIDGQFCDVIVNVVKAPFDEIDKTTLWVSDYTENDAFHKFSWDGVKLGAHGRDQYGGYTDTLTATKWVGPFGRRSMQITCFEPHASQVKSEVQLGQWIRFRNLRIKFGKSGLNLEGVLHEDRDFNNRLQIEVLKLNEKDNCDPKLRDAIQRKKEYENLKKQQKSFAENEMAGGAGGKRKAENNDSDSESDSDRGSPGPTSEQKVWEWRFALQLEDADPKLKGEKDKFWAIVNNIEGQQLTGLDACDLRRDPDVLNSLREQLFRLWGNLEELKLQEQNCQITTRQRVAANLPPPSSPMDIGHQHAQQKMDDAKSKGYSGVGLSNKPFSCCIQQAGVKLREPNSLLADAGEGRRWQRVYYLFGTKIQGFSRGSQSD